MVSTAHLLVVEDEADLREGVCDYLRMQGFDVTGCGSGDEMDAALQRRGADLVLLDLNLPGEGGLSLARRLRERPDPPAIIMVTALGGTVDRVVGLELGADDYIPKPFELRELLARIRSVLRRHHAVASPPGPAVPPRRAPLRFAGYSLDLDARSLRNPQGAEVPLTTMEFDLLHALAERPNRILTREQLLDLMHGKDTDPFDLSVDVRITRLRRKLADDTTNPRLIRTVRGVGYMFVPDAETA